jgi:GTP-binding protein
MIDSTTLDPKSDFDTLMNELKKYNPEMDLKRKLVCFSKADLIDEEKVKELQKIKFKKVTIKSVLISSVMHQNTDILKKLLWEEISKEG